MEGNKLLEEEIKWRIKNENIIQNNTQRIPSGTNY